MVHKENMTDKGETNPEQVDPIKSHPPARLEKLDDTRQEMRQAEANNDRDDDRDVSECIHNRQRAGSSGILPAIVERHIAGLVRSTES